MPDGWRHFVRKTIFVSCSSDMAAEAGVVRDVVEELNRRLPEGDRWDVYHWTDAEEPWPASGTWQQFIPRARDPRVGAMICLFGERLGSPLPAYFPLPRDIALPDWIAFPWTTARIGCVPLTGTVFELIDAVSTTDRAAPPVLCYIKVDAGRFASRDLSADERGYGFEQYYDRLRDGEKRIRSRARRADYDEQIDLLDRFCTAFFREGGRPWMCFGSELAGTEGTRDALRARLRKDVAYILGVATPDAEPRPLKGLAPYERADYAILFGRDRQIVRILDRLQARAYGVRDGPADVPILVLTGRSGEGKSSVVRAGLLGRLQHGRYFDYGLFTPVLVESLRPGLYDPLTTLTSAISAALRESGCPDVYGVDVDDVVPGSRASAIVSATRSALQAMPQDRSGRKHRLFVALDQFEDALVQDDEATRGRLLELFAALRALAQAHLAWIVVSMRTDHIGRLLRLRPELATAIQTLQPPGRDDLAEIVERSFSVAGLDATADETNAVLVQAETWLARQADPGPVLPLLGALLAEIVQARNKPSGPIGAGTGPGPPPALTLEGVIDRLAERACERAFGRAKAWVFELLPRLLRQLATTGVTAGSHFAIARECSEDHPAIVQARALVDALLEERLLYRSGPGMLRLVHVSIVEHWKRAAAWYEEDRKYQEALVHLDARAERWARDRAAGRAGRLLVDGVDIDDVADLWSNWPDERDRLPIDFMRASLINWFEAETGWSEDVQRSSEIWALFKAIGTNDPALIDTLFARVTRFAEPMRRDVVNGRGSALVPIFMALYRANAEAVRRLIEFGAAIDVADDRGRTPLHFALMFGGQEIVRLLVEYGADVDHVAADGTAPLMLAAGYGVVSSVELLLEHGASIDRVGAESGTALVVAAESGCAEVVDVLLRRGADVDRCRSDGSNALILAARSGYLTIVRSLLSHGASVDHVQEQGGTALMFAAAGGYREILSELLGCGAAIDRAALNGQTALMMAAEIGRAEVVADLLECGAAVDKRANLDATALLYACQGGDVATVRALLAHGASLDDCTTEGESVLQVAARSGHVGVIRELAAHGLTVERAQRQGGAPLQAAAVNGQLDALREILRAGADVAYRPDRVATALVLAAANGRVGAMRILLDHGASTEQIGDQNATALNVATDAGQLEAVRVLLEHGARIEHAIEDGTTSLGLAARGGYVEIVRELLSRGADPARGASYTPLIIASQNGHVEVVRELLESGASTEQVHDAGMAALTVAANAGHAEIVRVLLDHGAQIEQRMPTGYTALRAAAQAGHVEIVNELLARGAVFDEANDDGYGWTPLQNASMGGHIEIVKALISRGAEVDHEQFQGWTALMIAAEYGRSEVVSELLRCGASIEHHSHDDDRTALRVAAMFGQLEVVVVLLEAGACINVQDRWGMTALYMASLNGHTPVVRLLLARGADPTLATRGPNEERWSPLEAAARSGHRDVVDVLRVRPDAAESDRACAEQWLQEAAQRVPPAPA